MTLDKNGVETRHIIKLSSHKNESTVKEYATECPTKKRKEMFQYLSDSINPQQNIKKQKSATISINPDNKHSDTTLTTQNLDQGTILDLPNMQLQEINNFDTIDDDLLANMLYKTEKENCDQNKQIQGPTTDIVDSGTKNQINFNTVNNNPISLQQNVPNMPKLPPMYFPHSNVTINYNFQKWNESDK